MTNYEINQNEIRAPYKYSASLFEAINGVPIYTEFRHNNACKLCLSLVLATVN